MVHAVTKAAVRPRLTSAGKVKSAVGAGPSPALDRFVPSTPPIDVMSFNTAGDGCRHTPEAQIPDSQPFQAVIQGQANAPIIACQETTSPLAEKLGQLSKNGNFQVICQGPTWLPSFFRASAFAQGNLVVVPKRYKVESVQWHDFSGRVGLTLGAIGDFLFHHGSLNDIVGAVQRRGYVSLRLEDRTTGKQFTLIATHLNGNDTVRRTEEPQLIRGIEAAQKNGPVTVLGDFNTPSEATNFDNDPAVTAFWQKMDAAGVTDQFPQDQTSGGQDIDHVLTAGGFTAVGHEVYSGNKLTIPGRPDASQVSDHYAHEVSLRIP